MPNDQTARCSMLPYTTKKWTNHTRIKQIYVHISDIWHILAPTINFYVYQIIKWEKNFTLFLSRLLQKKKSGMGDIEKRKLLW